MEFRHEHGACRASAFLPFLCRSSDDRRVRRAIARRRRAFPDRTQHASGGSSNNGWIQELWWSRTRHSSIKVVFGQGRIRFLLDIITLFISSVIIVDTVDARLPFPVIANAVTATLSDVDKAPHAPNAQQTAP
jgi:hypothetical protein